MKILYKRSEGALLPDIDAYVKYLNQDPFFQAYDSRSLTDGYDLKDFDAIWEFKGLGGDRPENQLLIHEYASLSTGRFAKLKNLVKSIKNPKPDLRVFLNQDVRDGFYFRDGIDQIFRDMGLDQQFIDVPKPKKEFDFIYVGSVSKEREIDKLLHSFTQHKQGKLHLVGTIEDDEIYTTYKDHPDITFVGRVDYADIPELASKAVYGINYIPNKYPYTLQTSTKMLEYSALDLKIISTDYKWARDFERKHGSKFYYLNEAMDFNLTNIDKFEFKNNFNAADYTWDKVFEQAQLKDRLKELWK